MAVTSGHTRPSLPDPDHQHWRLPKSRCQQLYFKILKDAQDASRLLQTLPALQLAPVLLFSPRMVGGKCRHPWPGSGKPKQESRCLGGNEALTSPNPLPRAGKLRGARAGRALQPWIALIMPEIAAQKVQAQKRKFKKRIIKSLPWLASGPRRWRASIYLPGSAAGAAPSAVLTGRGRWGSARFHVSFYLFAGGTSRAWHPGAAQPPPPAPAGLH